MKNECEVRGVGIPADLSFYSFMEIVLNVNVKVRDSFTETFRTKNLDV